MSDIDPELLAEQTQDALYLEELNHYVNTLATPSAEAVALYSAKLSMLEDIHTEIRTKYPDFMPDYDAIKDEYITADPKYLETAYSFSNRDFHGSRSE